METAMTDLIVELPAACADVGEIEQVLSNHFENTGEDIVLDIDMRHVVYITAPCFIYLIAFINTQYKRNKEVKIHVPLSPDVRNIMRIWRFPIVLKEVTGLNFSSLVH